MNDIDNNRRTIYQELCNSYRAIDEFRARLLGFLPLATGTGILLLLSDKVGICVVEPYLRPVGIFGSVVTLGLFFFELYGIKKCTCLIRAGVQLEINLGIENGQFNHRPPGVAGFINEPIASGVIYPAVLAVWVLLAFDCVPKKDFSSLTWQDAVHLWAIWSFAIGFLFSFFYGRWCSSKKLLCPKFQSLPSANQEKKQSG